MAFTDKALKCVDCSADFTFSAKQQEKHAELGFTNEPKRCQPCREVKKAKNGGGDRRGPGNRTSGAPRELFKAVCADCGGEAMVPFQPRGDRPIYCSKCFEGHR